MRKLIRTLINQINMTDPVIYGLVPADVRLKRDGYALSLVISFIWGFILTAYLVQISTNNYFIAFLIAMLVSTSIFLYDRSIINSSSKLSAAPRILIAIIIASVLAIPGELLLMRDRIDQEISRESIAKNLDEYTLINENIRLAREQYQQAESEYHQSENKLQEKIDNYEKNYSYHAKMAKAEQNGIAIPNASGLLGKGKRYRFHEGESNKFRNLLSNSRTELSRMLSRNKEKLGRMRKNRNLVVADYQERLRKNTPAPAYDLLGRFEALENLKQDNFGIWILSWLLRLFTMSIDLLPILKFLSEKPDEYNSLVQSRTLINLQSINAMTNQAMDDIKKDPDSSNGQISNIRQKVHK